MWGRWEEVRILLDNAEPQIGFRRGLECLCKKLWRTRESFAVLPKTNEKICLGFCVLLTLV